MPVNYTRSDNDLGWLLDNLVNDIRHCRGALLLSADGISKMSSGLDDGQDSELAATVSGLLSLAGNTWKVSGKRESVRRVVVELDDCLLFITAAGSGSVLAVVTDREADAANVGFATSKFTAAVKPSLTTPERLSAR